MKQNYTKQMQTDKVLSELLHIADEDIKRNGDTTLMSHIIEAMQVVEQQTGNLFAEKSIDRAKVISLLRELEVDLVCAKHNCESQDVTKVLDCMGRTLTIAIEEVDSDG
jgi:hypothetical protein|tara:strand:- start:1511 stop:1837 length:327 start_codon:yes stop_codon:yes gene_type:complete